MTADNDKQMSGTIRKILVISANYPGPDYIYGDVFVHTRLKKYSRYTEVVVVGYNEGLLAERDYIYEGIQVFITGDLNKFRDLVISHKPDVVIGHLINHVYIDFLIGLNKPLIVFVHGYEALSWKHRAMNYRTLGDLRYLLPYIYSNRIQLSKFRELAEHANNTSGTEIIFVSDWLKKMVERDLRLTIRNASIVPNGIDVDLFNYSQKDSNLRKKILVLRSFKARNYANDIAIDVILRLSKKDFFNDLQFTIYGEGYLFPIYTDKVKAFSNVCIHNFFVENKKIPLIHKDHGIFLCPSRLDTQGVSMCEAMASGLIPLTNPVGGIPEYAEHGVSSFQENSAEDMAQRIEQLYYDVSLFSKMSANARLSIESKCALDKTVLKEIEIIKRIAK